MQILLWIRLFWVECATRRIWFWIILYASAHVCMKLLYLAFISRLWPPMCRYASMGSHGEWKFCNFTESYKILFYWLSLWVLRLIAFIALLTCFITSLMNSNSLRNLLGKMNWILLIILESRDWEESNGGHMKPLSSVQPSCSSRYFCSCP